MEEELSALARAYNRLDQLRAQERKLVNAIAQAEVVVLKKLSALPEGTVMPVSLPDVGRTYRFSAGVQRVWSPTSWEEVYDFVKTSGRFDVLQRRLNSGAVADLHSRGEAPWAVPFDRHIVQVRTSAYVADK